MHKYFFLFIILLSILTNSSIAVEIKGSVFNELSSYDLNNNSSLNPSNLYSIGNLLYYMRGDLVFKSGIGENSKGAIKIEAQYYPVSSNFTNSTNAIENIFIKEMYIDLIFDFMVVRTGKQFVKWGDGVFFNPIDIVNLQSDPLKPPDEAEGNPFISILFPIQSFMSVELFSMIKPGETTNISNLPVIPKLSFDAENFSGFAFAVLENSKQPQYGLNFDYVNSLSENNNLKFYTEFMYQQDHVNYRFDKNGNGFTNVRSTNENYAVLLGGSFSQSLPDFKFLDSISLAIEYLYQSDVWSRDNFINYYDYMNSVQNNISQHYYSLQYYQMYKNSRNYLFSSLSLGNFIIPNVTVNNSVIMNLTDYSGIYVPDISYFIDTMNMSFDLNADIFYGGRNTEFGNFVYNSAINLWTQINF